MNDSIQKSRSPNCPPLPLSGVIERAKVLYDKIGRSKVKRESAVIALGYTSLNGRALGALGALAQYGLIINANGEVSISPAALNILHPLDADKKAKAISESALAPKIFREIFENSPDVSEDVLTNMLVHKGFTEDAAKRSASIYKENFLFANLGNLSNVPFSQEETQSPQSEPAPKTGQRIVFPQKATNPMHPSQSAISANELPIPIGDGIARVPYPISEEDFDLFIGTLNLWKKKLTTKPTPPPDEDLIG